MTDQTEESADKKRKQQEKEYHRLVKGDEFAYVIGVANLTFSAWLCGAFPAGYWMYHCIKLSALLIYRIYHWIKINLSLFLVEYCYIVNYSLLIFYLLSFFQNDMFRNIIPQFYVHQKDIFRCFFSAASGPLAASVMAFGNKFVFHDIELFTIVSVHLSPAVSMWGMRWYPDTLEEYFPGVFNLQCKGKQFDFWNPAFTSTCGESSGDLVTQLVIYPIIFYVFVWAVPYYIFMFVFSRKTIQENKYRNMFDDTVKNTPLFAGKPWLYLCFHFIGTSIMFVLNLVFFRSFHAHTFYLLLLLTVSVHNGGYYYFEVFAKKYAKNKEEAAANKEDKLHNH